MGRRKKVTPDWFVDRESDYRRIYHRVKNRIFSARTRFQNVDLIDTDHLGRMVILDEKIQSAEADEFVYHEALVHPAMMSHPCPERVLLLGGGEGATLREVLRHPSVLKVVMVDVDEEFVRFCRRYLTSWHQGSFDSSKVEFVFGDALRYVRETKRTFDVIIGDISDPVEEGPGRRLYTREFYVRIWNRLKRDGIFATHATEIFYTADKTLSTKIFSILKKIFPNVSFYYEYIPSFGCLWSYIVCSSRHDPGKMGNRVLEKRLQERGLGRLSYYDAETHRRLFALPKCVRRRLARR
ncbi:MAG: polyamine aminopropyltransferase [Nitrospirota bacterium]